MLQKTDKKKTGQTIADYTLMIKPIGSAIILLVYKTLLLTKNRHYVREKKIDLLFVGYFDKIKNYA